MAIKGCAEECQMESERDRILIERGSPGNSMKGAGGDPPEKTTGIIE